MGRITSALYVDVDNLASHLMKLDRAAGLAFLCEPGRLVERLATLDQHQGGRRDLLVRRAYLNPAGRIPDPDAPDDPDRRIPISECRGPFTGAGFEVVDCPTLAPKAKNAADIRMVVDALDAANGAVRYDEFTIASSDSDFTPLLLRLRAADRRTTIITAGPVAAAYGAAADRRIDGWELLTLLTPSPRLVAAPDLELDPRAAAAAQRPSPTSSAPPPDPGSAQRAARALTGLLAESNGPVSLSSAGKAMRDAAGTDEVSATKWFGHRTLTRFVRERITDLAVDATSVWDPARHAPPAAS